MVDKDEHIIKCSICGRGLIVKDIVNDGLAFLSHLRFECSAHVRHFLFPLLTRIDRRKGVI